MKNRETKKLTRYQQSAKSAIATLVRGHLVVCLRE